MALSVNIIDICGPVKQHVLSKNSNTALAIRIMVKDILATVAGAVHL